MADRAMRTDRSGRGIVELDKDERWQSRLAEARARRAIALQEKTGNEPPPKARPKPWEDDGEVEDIKTVIEPLIRPEDAEKLDFSDRVDTLRSQSPRAGDNGGPLPDAPDERHEPLVYEKRDDDRTEPLLVEARPSLADRYFEMLSDDFVPERPYVPETREPVAFDPAPSILRSDRPAGRGFADSNAATLEPDRGTPEVAAAALARPRRPVRRGVPALLLAGVCLLAILPFTKTVAPVEKGPLRIVATPVFGLQPALGLPRPMNAFPRTSTSGEWKTSAPFAPGGPLALSLDRAALTQREVAPLEAVAPGEDTIGPLGWSPIGAGLEPAAAPRLAVPSAVGLPGAPEAVASPEELLAEAPIPEPLSELRVTVMVPSAADLGMAEGLAEDLVLRGHEVTTVRAVDLKISERNIRFYFEKDRGETARLAEAYDARLRDFTDFRPRPSEGTVEIWLEGEGAARPVVVAPVRRAPPPEPVAVAPVPRVVIVQRTPSLMGRIADALGGGHQGDGKPDPTISGGADQVIQAPAPAPVAPAPAPTGSGTGTTTGGTGTTTGGTGTTTGGTGTTTGGTGTTTGGTGTTTGGTGTTTGGTGTTTGS